MLDIKYIRENADIVKQAAKNKLFNVDIDRLLDLDVKIKALNQNLDNLKTERNTLSSEISKITGEEKQAKINRVKEIKEQITPLENELAPLKEEYDYLMLLVPNPTLDEVPVGKDDTENVEVEKFGDIDELIEEGFVRELISKIQNLRKESGFEVQNHIEMYYSDNKKLAEIIERNKEQIADETLADKSSDSARQIQRYIRLTYLIPAPRRLTPLGFAKSQDKPLPSPSHHCLLP